MCSQHAIIESEILNERGISSRMIGLSGHVVLQTHVDEKQNEWWVLDPDYGVVIPYSLEAIETNPNLIAPFYSKAGYSERTITTLVDIYDQEGNMLFHEKGVKGYASKTSAIESASYIAIWGTPLLLGLLPIIRKTNAIFKKKLSPPIFMEQGIPEEFLQRSRNTLEGLFIGEQQEWV